MLYMHSEVGNLQDGLRHIETKFEKHETESMKKSFHQLFSSLLSWFKKRTDATEHFRTTPSQAVHSARTCWCAFWQLELKTWLKPWSNPCSSLHLHLSFAIRKHEKTLCKTKHYWTCNQCQDFSTAKQATCSAVHWIRARQVCSWPSLASKIGAQSPIRTKSPTSRHKLTEIARRILWDLINLKQDTYWRISRHWQLKWFCLSSTFCLSAVQQLPISIVSLHLPSCNMQTALHDTSATSPDSTVQPVWTFLQHLGNVRNMEVFTVRELKQLTKATPHSNKDSKDSHCKTIYLWQSSVYKQPHTLIRLF